MLKQVVVDEVVRLLAEGKLSQRRIAATVGVSRGIVNAIARGDRGLCRQSDGPKLYESFHRSVQPAARCPSCGGRVYLPCVACRARTYRHRRQSELAAAYWEPPTVSAVSIDSHSSEVAAKVA